MSNAGAIHRLQMAMNNLVIVIRCHQLFILFSANNKILLTQCFVLVNVPRFVSDINNSFQSIGKMDLAIE